MAPSITGFAYLLMSLGLGLFAWRFFQSWQKTEKEQKKKSEVGKWLFYFLAIFTLLCILTAIIGLFFSRDIVILKGLVITTCFLLALASAAAAYLIFYLTIPRITSWYGFWAVLFFGLITAILTILTPFEPSLEVNGGINWDFHPPVSLLRFSLYLVTFLPLSIIFIRQFHFSGDTDVKIKTIALILIFSLGLAISYIEFILEPTFQLPALTSDIFIGFLGFILILFGLLPLLPLKFVDRYFRLRL